MTMDTQVRRMTAALGGGLLALVLVGQPPSAAGTPPARAPAPHGTPAPAAAAPKAKSLREFLTEPLFQFSQMNKGIKRRDPFLVPLTKIVPDSRTGTPMTPERYKQLVAEESARLKTLRAALEALKAAMTANKGSTVLRLYQELDEGLQQSFGVTMHKGEANRLHAEFEALQPAARHVLVAAALDLARTKAGEIQAAFDAGRYEEVARLASEFDQLTAISAARDSPAWKDLQGRIAALARRAQVRIEFKTKTIQVSSIFITRRGGAAIINDVPCGDGARLDEDTLVATVKTDMIVFVYKGERIEYRFRTH